MISIDPAEAMLAVIGMQPILSKEVERVTMEQVREMANIQRTVYSMAKEVMRGEVHKVPLGNINYKRMLDQITEKYDEAQVIAMASKFPPALHAITSDFIIDAGKAVDFLRHIFPIQRKLGFNGQSAVLPPATAIARYTTTYHILDNPLRTFAHIACGSLLKSQTLAVKQVFPTISAAISDAFEAAQESELNKKKSFQVPPKVQRGLAVWKDLPSVPLQLQQRLQQNFADADKEKEPPKAQTEGTAQSVAAKEAITNTQRALYPQTSKAG
jgi:hypothetical protein